MMMTRKESSMGSGRKIKFSIPLSISAVSRTSFTVTPVMMVLLVLFALVETGLCSDSSSSSKLKSSVASPTFGGTGLTGPSGTGDDSSSSSSGGTTGTGSDSETSESQSEPNAFDLIADWANNNEPLDSSNPVVASIATMLSGLGVGGLLRSQEHDDLYHDADQLHEIHVGEPEPVLVPVSVPAPDPAPIDDSISNDLQTGETISHFFRNDPPVKHVVHHEEHSWSFWDWLHSDGTHTALVLILFGVIPILIGILPLFLIATNFWFIFYKIHSLHAAFLELLHHPLDGLDHHHSYDYGSSHVGGGGEGWRYFRG